MLLNADSYKYIILADGAGEINQAGVDHYNRLIDALIAEGKLAS